MALARYQDLCIDAVDPDRMGRFWSSALGLRLDESSGVPYRLTGPSERSTVWINPVPESKTVKHRVHIDVNASSVEELRSLGALVVDDESFPWTVMSDPEGGEFCVFVRKGEISQRLYELVVDSTAPDTIAKWWAEVLGARLVHDERGFSYVDQIPGAPLDSISFVPVPEPKTVKNRVHFDVTTANLAALVAAGAKVLRSKDDDIDWTVLADPEGNEFCAFDADDTGDAAADAAAAG